MIITVSLIFFIAVQCGLLSWVIFKNRDRRNYRYQISVSSLFFTASLMFLELYLKHPLYNLFSYPLILLLGPLFFFSYAGYYYPGRSVISFFHFIPYIIYQIYIVISYLLIPGIDDYVIVSSIQILHLLFYTALMLKTIPRGSLKQYLLLLPYCLFILMKIFFTFFNIGLNEGAVITSISIIPVFIITYKLMKGEKMKSRIQSEDKEFLNSLERSIIDDKLYLTRNLTPRELGVKLEIPWYKISPAIKGGYGLGFSEYINRLRVEEAKSILSRVESKKLTMVAIAHDSGFNSKSSFNKIFKEVTGDTPTQFRKNLEE